jgi:hypothetical protein
LILGGWVDMHWWDGVHGFGEQIEGIMFFYWYNGTVHRAYGQSWNYVVSILSSITASPASMRAA